MIRLIRVRGFSAFSEELVLDSLDRLTVIGGRNDTGKTHLLNGVQRVLRSLSQDNVGWYHSDANTQVNGDAHFSIGVNPIPECEAAASIVYSLTWEGGHFNTPPARSISLEGPGREALASQLGSIPGYPQLTHQQANEVAVNHADALFRIVQENVGAVEYLPPIRKIRDRWSEAQTYGSQLGQTLLGFQSPESDPIGRKITVDNLQANLKDTLEDDTAYLTTDSSGNQILLVLGGQDRPIQEYGDGIQMATLILLLFHLKKTRLFLIDELETNFHPRLLGKVVGSILADPSSQIVTSSHSPSVINLDIERKAVFRLWREGMTVRASLALDRATNRHLLDDLGARPSDIMQANTVIWVEGPTDRLLLRALIRRENPALREHIDFAFILYGGALRSHYDFSEEPQGNTLIDALSLCRRAFILCDSDKEKPNQQSPRWVEQLKKDDSPKTLRDVFVTHGTAIENYAAGEVSTKIKLRGSFAKKELGRYERFAEWAQAQWEVRYGDKLKMDFMHGLCDKIESGEVLTKELAVLSKAVVDFITRK